MSRTTRNMAIFLTLAVLVTAFALPRRAQANDTGALIGGLLAGALVYEALDNDHGKCWYYGPPPYRTRAYYTPRPYYYPPAVPTYYYPPRAIYYPRPRYYYPRRVVYRYPYRYRYPYYGYEHRYNNPPAAVSRRAPSHAVKAGPPPRYADSKVAPNPKHKYEPPRHYQKD